MRNPQYSLRVVSFMLVGLLVASCRRDVSAAENSPMPSEPSKATALTSAPSFDEAGFSLRLVSEAPYKVEKPGVLRVELKAKSPYHVNQEYPHKLKLKPTDSLGISSQTLARDSMAIEPMSISVRVPLKPNQAGNAKVEGELAFSLCTADRCLIEKRTLATEIQVQ